MSQTEHLIPLVESKDLSEFNTLGFSARSAYFCQPDSVTQCRQALQWAGDNRLPVFPLGGGSNLILAGNIPGLTLQMNNREREYRPQADGSVLLRVGAGMPWHALVMETAGKGLYGLENLALIPGHAGAAPVQNIGAYGAELADCLVMLEAVRVRDAEILQLAAAECDFAYRHSIFKQPDYAVGGSEQLVITHLTLRLQTQAVLKLGYGDLRAHLAENAVTPLAVAEAVCCIRRSKLPDPAELGNAGSFFKNPVVSAEKAAALKQQYPEIPVYPVDESRCKLAAGWLVQQCGFKGVRRGTVGVYPRQALVLVHYGGGDAAQLLALADEIVAAVTERFQVVLEREPQMVPDKA